MENKSKSILKFLGAFIAVASFLGGIIHRFLHSSLTEVQWVINYWYIDVVVLVLAGIGLFIYTKNE